MTTEYSSARTGAAESARELPPQIGQHRPFADTVDAGLQMALESALEKKRSWRALIDHNKMAVGLVDLSTPQAARFASVNGYTMMYAASLSKIAVLLGAYQSIQDGTLKDSPALHAWLIRMIRLSNNAAASYLIDLIGLKRIEDDLLRYQFYVPQYGGGIWLGGSYPPVGLRNPEPIKGLCHAATAMQLCRFYYMLATGQIISPERSRQMLEILSHPGLHDKFVSVLETHVPPQRLFRKSGDWSLYYSDSVLVWDHDCRKYILAALIENKDGEQILRDLVPVVEKLLAPAQMEARSRELRQIASLKAQANVKQPGSSPFSSARSAILNGFHKLMRCFPQGTQCR
ncbi:MAG: serine hydrolase [Syntrophobacteraceae bacterium]|nr:serine hydrolase [Syntrophobacteraceae bacterium]